jgi:RNA polymerase II-associated factor 1
LPALPFDPKFRVYPFSRDRFVRFDSGDLITEYKHLLLTENDLGIPIDLIDPDAYKPPTKKIALAPEDKGLIEKVSVSNRGLKKRETARPNVPWLRKMEYMSQDYTHEAMYTRGRGDSIESKMLLPKDTGQRSRDLPREQQREIIERTFAATREPPMHPKNKSLVPVEILPLFPSFDLWENDYVQVVFESDPSPLQPHPNDPQYTQKLKLQESLVSRSILKPFELPRDYAAEDERDAMALLVPRRPLEETVESRLFGEEEEELGREEEHQWVREYQCDPPKEKDLLRASSFCFIASPTSLSYVMLSSKLRAHKVQQKRGATDILRPSRVMVKKVKELTKVDVEGERKEEEERASLIDKDEDEDEEEKAASEEEAPAESPTPMETEKVNVDE